MNKKLFAVIACAILLSSSLIFAAPPNQKGDKPWTEWTQKEAEKVLSSSPWSQAQVDTDTSEMFFTPTEAGTRNSGARNQAVDVKFVVRFFSARPVRRALARIMEIKNKPDAAMTERLHAFADVKSTESIILTVSVETTDQRYSGIAMQAMSSAITATMKNETFLERNSKRYFLHEYVPPGSDGFGARFIFLRNVDDKPIIDSNSGEVRFVAKYPNGIRVDRRFKVGDMMYEGELEY
jgi:hypothetical protein